MGAFSLSERRLEFLRFPNDMPAALPGGAGFPQLPDGCVLALTDPTPDGVNAAWRAALLARDRGAQLHLLCAAHSDVCGLAPVHAMVHDLARCIRQRLHVTASAACVPGGLREQLAGFAEQAALLVLPWRRGNLLVDAVLGTPAERMYRSLFLPMLIVRRPALTSYRRVLVPVKLDAGAVALIRAVRSMSRDPRMRVFHVLDTWQDGALRLADASERTLRLQRRHRSRRAYSALDEIIRCAGAHGQDAASLVSFGHVAARVLAIARAGDAQLIVAGKERRSLLSELFFPSLTHRLLLDAGADVLVLPLPASNATFGVPLPRGGS